MNNRQICYTYGVKLSTLTDYNLLEYVKCELYKDAKKYRFTGSIRPTEFLYNQLNVNQRIIYDALTKEDERECPICYEALGERNTIRTPCNHCFCKDCFSKIIESSVKCPCCRREILRYEELFITPVEFQLCFVFIPYSVYNDCIMLYNRWMSLLKLHKIMDCCVV
jgi:hypothetical protein